MRANRATNAHKRERLVHIKETWSMKPEPGVTTTSPEKKQKQAVTTKRHDEKRKKSQATRRLEAAPRDARA